MSVFKFKHFSILQEKSAMKVGTDAMLLGAMVESENPKKILDIGAGTGVLSLMMAQRFPHSSVSSIEIDLEAFNEMKINFKNSIWSERLFAFHGDFREGMVESNFDLIISNPPYYQTNNKNNDERKSIARHEEFLPVRDFIQNCESILSIKGAIWVIIPKNSAEKWIQEIESNNFFCVKRIDIIGKQYSEVKRLVLKITRQNKGFIESSFTIRDFNNNYSDDYIKLTKEFHSKDLKG